MTGYLTQVWRLLNNLLSSGLHQNIRNQWSSTSVQRYSTSQLLLVSITAVLTTLNQERMDWGMMFSRIIMMTPAPGTWQPTNFPVLAEERVKSAAILTKLLTCRRLFHCTAVSPARPRGSLWKHQWRFFFHCELLSGYVPRAAASPPSPLATSGQDLHWRLL